MGVTVAGPVMLGLTLGVLELVPVVDIVLALDAVKLGVCVVEPVFVTVSDDVCVPVRVLEAVFDGVPVTVTEGVSVTLGV